MSSSPPVVYKFGGAALVDGTAIRHAASIVAALPHRQVVVTVSAMAAVTNTLFDIALHAATGDLDTGIACLDALRYRHVDTWAATCDEAMPAAIPTLFAAIEQTLRGVAAERVLFPHVQDAIVTLGERVAAHLMVGVLRTHGVRARFVEATTLVHTDGRHGNAMPSLIHTTKAVQQSVLPLLADGIVPVVPGFIGCAPDGTMVTLGRGGTDLTATTLAAALNAAEVVLWKDVPGILTADPQIVPDARVIPELHVREAAELAYYGAKVLHPRSLIPLRNRACVMRIKPVTDPSASGTLISTKDGVGQSPVRALSAMPHQALVTVSGNGMLGVSGIAARTFGALQSRGISISLISQGSSEHSICFIIPEQAADNARDGLVCALADELARGEIDNIDIRPSMATLAVVGLGMAGHPGIAARLFAALGKREINVVAIAQGSSELNISIVINAEDLVRAQCAIHDEFQLGKIGGGTVLRIGAPQADVILLGCGVVGRALTEMLIASEDAAPQRVRLVGIVDRSGYVFDPAGISPERLKAIVSGKQSAVPLGAAADGIVGTARDALSHMLSHALRRPILVDVTAGETTPLLQYAVDNGADLVLANKRPVSGSRTSVTELHAAVVARGRRMLYEATVGAGLPILDTFAKLIQAGDTINTIEGCPSGTMGYLFGKLGHGTSFSAALQETMQLGYTEPDPRDDLSGADVARKALILGRLLGFDGELDDVHVESLVPEDAISCSREEFLTRLASYDAIWSARINKARQRGMVLRYRATATLAAVTVRLVEVPLDSMLGLLEGTDNQFSFTTERYKTNPLVITGPGAGPAVTAAGVLNDVLKLAGTQA